MATIDTSVTNAMLDEAIGDATNGLVKAKLMYSDYTESGFVSVAWGAAASGEIDISSNVVFGDAASGVDLTNKSVSGFYLFHDDETTPGILYYFESIYEYGDAGGTFTISSIPITVG